MHALTTAVLVACGCSGCGRLGYELGSTGLESVGPDGGNAVSDEDAADGAPLLTGADPFCPDGPPLDDVVVIFGLEEGAGPGYQDSGPLGLVGQCQGVCGEAVGPIGTAVSLDGTSHVRIAASDPAEAAATDLKTTGFTVSAWFRPDDLTMSQSLVAKQTVNAGNSFQVLVTTGGKVDFNSDSQTSGRTVITTPDFEFTVGNWRQVAVSWNPNGGEKAIYIDGVQKILRSGDDIDFEPTDILIGADDDETVIDNLVTGAMDDVRIYRRVLSGPELSALAACGALDRAR